MTLPPVLFIHGMWADRAHWNRFRRHFENRGFDTHAVTLLFHEPPQDLESLHHVGLMDYVAQVQEVVQKFDQPPVIVGHSMGSLVAQKLAEIDPVRALVLLSPVAPRGIVPLTPSVAISTSASILDAVFCRPFVIPARNARFGILNTLSAREQSVVYRSFKHESGRALWEIFRGMIAVDELRITCPVLVAVGSMDRITPAVVARRIASKYGAEIRTYPGECHYLSASRAVMTDVADWLQQQVSG